MNAVLPAGRQAKIRLSIVQTVIIYMVHHQMVGSVHYYSVHENRTYLRSISFASMAFCVEGGAVFCSEPFITAETIVIDRVNNGEFSPCQRYPAERIAEA